MCKESFLLHRFFEKRSRKTLIIQQHLKWTFLNYSDSSVCITPWSQVPRCASLCGLHHSTELISVVCITPQNRAPWCATLRRVELRGVCHSAESKCILWSQNQNLCDFLVASKWTIRINPLREEHICH